MWLVSFVRTDLSFRPSNWTLVHQTKAKWLKVRITDNWWRINLLHHLTLHQAYQTAMVCQNPSNSPSTCSPYCSAESARNHSHRVRTTTRMPEPIRALFTSVTGAASCFQRSSLWSTTNRSTAGCTDSRVTSAISASTRRDCSWNTWNLTCPFTNYYLVQTKRLQCRSKL